MRPPSRTPRWLRIAAVGLVLIVVAARTPAAAASTFVSENNYTLAEGETVDGNLYAFGATVVIEGTVDGDLIAAGQSVEIAPSGRVTGDLLAAGQDVRVEGTVEGDIRAAGFAVQVVSGGTVGGELVGAGYSVGVEDHATVGDDLTAAGYQGIVDGQIGGNVRFSGAGLGINGAVGGDVSADLGSNEGGAPPMQVMSQFMKLPAVIRDVAPGLQIGNEARIAGDLKYSAVEETTPPASVVGGEVKPEILTRTEEPSKPKQSLPVRYGKSALGLFIGLLLFGFVVLLVGSRLVERLYDVMQAKPLPSTGWGCLSLVLVPILLVAVGAITLGALLVFGFVSLGSLKVPILSAGFLSSAVLTAGVLLAAWLGWVVVALWLGRKLVALARPEAATGRAVPFTVGAFILALLIALPYFLGNLIGLFAAALGLGALVLLAQSRWPLDVPVASPPVDAA